jgi:hypothetical protein
MAHTADLRSEGKNSPNPQAVASRNLRAERKRLGICTLCGIMEVKNRFVCYDCSALQSVRTYRSGLRYHLKAAGVDLESGVIPSNAEDILRALVIEAKYQHQR